MPLFETITDLQGGADLIRRRRYGFIEAAAGRVAAVHFRAYPKWASLPEALFWGAWRHRHWEADCCRLYFNQPWRFPNFLAIPYALSGRKTKLSTLHAALGALDEIARIKRTDAIFADVLNFRISPRSLARHGWSPHKPSRWHRHYIKRFYGEYPGANARRACSSGDASAEPRASAIVAEPVACKVRPKA